MPQNQIVIVAQKSEQPLIESCFCSLGFHVAGAEELSQGKKSRAGLVVTTRAWLDQTGEEFRRRLEQFCQLAKSQLLVVGARGDERFAVPVEYLAPEIDLVALHALLQRCCKGYSRRHLRLNTKLPGVISRADSCQICEITNLSAGGAFVKTGTPLGVDGAVTLYVPLLGQKRELELGSQVVFQVVPSEANNFQQGAGLRFADGDEQAAEALQRFIVHLHDSGLEQSGALRPAVVSGDETGRGRPRGGGRERRLSLQS